LGVDILDQRLQFYCSKVKQGIGAVMEMISVLLGVAVFIGVGLVAIYSLKHPGSRDRLKKDYGLTDQQIDEKFGAAEANEADLESLEEEKRKKDRVA
jgi:hypothetical protein